MDTQNHTPLTSWVHRPNLIKLVNQIAWAPGACFNFLASFAFEKGILQAHGESAPEALQKLFWVVEREESQEGAVGLTLAYTQARLVYFQEGWRTHNAPALPPEYP